jgi:predicted PhzF superfamily epimerase YddE/YHI9
VQGRIPSIPILGIDAFTSERFRGNPAAVCLLDEPADEGWMQSIAFEMNLSETAFVVPQPDGHAFGLRWFTPTQEVELCGHATLASAHALWDTNRIAPDHAAKFRTRWKGELLARRDADAIALDLPKARSEAVDEPAGLSAALGASVIAVARNDLHHIAEVEQAATVRALSPDFAALAAVEIEAVTVTARSDDPAFDFVSRYFAPRHGIEEDPVTGAAHTGLGPYWSEKLGLADLRAYQASARGGTMRVSVEPDAAVVTLTGSAVTVWRGELA